MAVSSVVERLARGPEHPPLPVLEIPCLWRVGVRPCLGSLWWQDPGDTLDVEGVQRLPLPLEGTGGPTDRAPELTAPASLITEMGRLSVWEKLSGERLLSLLRVCACPVIGLFHHRGSRGQDWRVCPPWDKLLHPLTVGWPSCPASGTYSHQGHQLRPHSETQLKQVTYGCRPGIEPHRISSDPTGTVGRKPPPCWF